MTRHITLCNQSLDGTDAARLGNGPLCDDTLDGALFYGRLASQL